MEKCINYLFGDCAKGLLDTFSPIDLKGQRLEIRMG
jgi:hypothetical protein